MNLFKLADKTGQAPDEMLRLDENPFSTNKVTGWSLNFPIARSCIPTKVCAKTCYFARGPSTWTASLAKQVRLQNRLDADPDGLADQIVAWVERLGMDFVRWHGGGDMTAMTGRCLDRVAIRANGVPQWVVTRRPALAAGIMPRPNVFVHISIDASSIRRLREFVAIAPPALQWFWSYQCDAGEVPPPEIAAVVFRDHYKPMLAEAPAPDDCPLNWAGDISGACGKCRRCFDGTAVDRAGQLLPRMATLLAANGEWTHGS